jgi:hypothetical protein
VHTDPPVVPLATVKLAVTVWTPAVVVVTRAVIVWVPSAIALVV